VVDDGCPEVSSEGLLLMRFLQSVNGHHAVQRVTGGEIRREEDREGRKIGRDGGREGRKIGRDGGREGRKIGRQGRKEDREGRYILVTDGRKTGSDVDFKSGVL
jgi:hypothetical protein